MPSQPWHALSTPNRLAETVSANAKYSEPGSEVILSGAREEGEAVFYGPKIDVKLIDAIGRRWQTSTIQFDFNLPERFDMTYIGEDGNKHTPVMLHRAILGSLERFIGILIENYGGAFPAWLAPVQAVVIPIADRHNEAAAELAQVLRSRHLFVEVDDSGNRMQKKIKLAQDQKIPYMLILGEKEADTASVALRLRTGKQENGIPLADFIERTRRAIAEKVDL